MIFKRVVVSLLFVVSLLLEAHVLAAEPARVAIIPFKMNSERDLSFLRDGVFDMLLSRLSWGNRVVVIERELVDGVVSKIKGAIDERAARDIGNSLNADYVLFGSLTIFGESVSIDAKMVDVSGASPPVAVFNQGKGMDSVIPQIDMFASDINARVFGRLLPAQQAAQQPPEAAAAKAPPRGEDIYGHPEKLLGEGGGYDYGEVMQSTGLNPDFIVESSASSGGSFWKSRSFKENIRGLSMGDVDGDGNQEAIFVSENKVFVYRNIDTQFMKVKEFTGEPSHNFLGVDVADINRNGKAEIFVTSLNTTRNSLESFVLEWENNDFRVLSDKNNWYYRVQRFSGPGRIDRILLGQKRGISEPFVGGVHELGWQGGGYEPVRQIDLPRGINVYSFAMGNLFNDGNEMILAFNEDDYLEILTGSGSSEWKSDEPYGGSLNYFDIQGQAGGTAEKDRVFLTQRIFLTDLDQDGNTEVIVVQNQAGSGRVFKRFRHFTSSQIASLSWNGLGLAVNWRTRKIHGYVSDFAIGDFDNDGQDELVAAVVSNRGASFLAEAKSSIISYDLAAPKT